ncbi:TetR/AcrR family transcriptional regulator [Streptomyces sp. NPDC059092]|uniref:TetR/AcrR family transcriptional regulator n=1 Tax=Streptomyces sp. NPDC059092 TaxID=3346725 RepID=UPI0036CCFDD0
MNAGRTATVQQTAPVRAEHRLDIARAATGLFMVKGVERTSLTDIADAAGIPASTLWSHFPTKEECVTPLFSYSTERIARRLDTWPPDHPLIDAFDAFDGEDWLTPTGPSGEETLRAILDALRLTRAEPSMHTLWIRESFAALPVVARAIAARSGRAEQGMDATVQASMLLSALQFALRAYAWTPPEARQVDLMDTLLEAVRIAMRGLPA